MQFKTCNVALADKSDCSITYKDGLYAIDHIACFN